MNHFKSPHWQSIHGKAIVIIGFTVGLLWAASIWMWNDYLRPRKENYPLLKKNQQTKQGGKNETQQKR